MESQKPKIAMYVKRPFGEKLNASFDFIKENWKQLFKYSTYLILPICLIQAANFSGLMGSMTDLSAMQTSGGIGENPLAALGPSFALNYAGVIFFSCLGGLLLTSLIYEYLIPGGRNPCFALIGAVYGVGSRFEEGFHNGINRLIGTFVGGILVIPFYMLYQKQPFGIPAFLWLAAGLCLVLWCNLALQADSAIQPGIVVYFVVLYTVGEERVVFYTLARILDTGIGVLISLLCYLLLPSKYDKEQGLSFRTMWKATKHAFQSYKDKNRLFREDEQKNFGMKNKK